MYRPTSSPSKARIPLNIRRHREALRSCATRFQEACDSENALLGLTGSSSALSTQSNLVLQSLRAWNRAAGSLGVLGARFILPWPSPEELPCDPRSGLPQHVCVRGEVAYRLQYFRPANLTTQLQQATRYLELCERSRKAHAALEHSAIGLSAGVPPIVPLLGVHIELPSEENVLSSIRHSAASGYGSCLFEVSAAGTTLAQLLGEEGARSGKRMPIASRRFALLAQSVSALGELHAAGSQHGRFFADAVRVVGDARGFLLGDVSTPPEVLLDRLECVSPLDSGSGEAGDLEDVLELIWSCTGIQGVLESQASRVFWEQVIQGRDVESVDAAIDSLTRQLDIDARWAELLGCLASLRKRICRGEDAQRVLQWTADSLNRLGARFGSLL
ncbi:MAG: hypothetical protein AAF355_10695 [Myxococcota bacterium]